MIDSESSHTPRGVARVVRPGDGERVRAFGNEIEFMLTGEQTADSLTGRHWTLQTPSGFERYFARAAEVFAAPGPPDVAGLAAIGAEYGYSFAKASDQRGQSR
jgi:hypothetical protein